MAEQHFNHARIKRQAHNLSRRDTENWWSPVRHLYYSKKQRSSTWEPDLEMNQEQGEGENGSPIEHASTEPTPTSRPYQRQDDGGKQLMNAPYDDDIQENYIQPPRESQRSTESSGDATYVDSQTHQSSNEVNGKGEDGLRARPGKHRQDTGKGSAADGSQGDEKSGHGQGLLSKLRHKDTEASDGSEAEKSTKQHTWFKNVKPKEKFTVGNQIRRTLFGSWINILILAAPAGIALNYVGHVNGIIIFVVNFLAIIPLAAMLSFGTEEIALRTGETFGGLLNATFGNAVELIVAIIALVQKKVLIVQTSLIGSVLSNLLLVMGMCFFFGGLRRQEQYFNTTVAQTAASLLALAVAAVIVPTVFDQSSNTPVSDVANLSRGTSVILLVVYGAYLFFQLKTHAKVFAEESKKVPAKPFRRELRKKNEKGMVGRGMVDSTNVVGAGVFSRKQDHEKLNKVTHNNPKNEHGHDYDGDDEPDEPQLEFLVALGVLVGSTVIIAFCAEAMVSGIGAVTASGAVSEEFVGLILLPIVGNAAEHVTAVTVAIKDKMDLAIGVAVGSSMQVALFVIPLLVVIGWGLHNDDMTLSFDMFQVAVLFVAVLLVNYLIADGKSHWLEGLLLICLYLIIAVCSWWYPTTGEVAG